MCHHALSFGLHVVYQEPSSLLFDTGFLEWIRNVELLNVKYTKRKVSTLVDGEKLLFRYLSLWKPNDRDAQFHCNHKQSTGILNSSILLS